MNGSEFVKSQYLQSGNLENRIQMYSYSVSRRDWHRWVYDSLGIQSGQRILEVGCGNGELWVKNLERLPPDISVVLTDQSRGMIDRAAMRLNGDKRFTLELLDIERDQPTVGEFHTVIANHMLYHVEHLEDAVERMSRCLAPDGTCFASTNSRRHLSEMDALLDAAQTPFSMPLISAPFCLENGARILEQIFGSVDLSTFENTMHVPDPEPVIAFLSSIFDGNSFPDITSWAPAIERAFERRMNSGYFVVTGRSGLFRCSDPRRGLNK